MCRLAKAKVALQTNGLLLPEHIGSLAQMFDEITISLDYLGMQNVEMGRHPNGSLVKSLLKLAGEYHNVCFTSVYLGDNLSDVLMLAEWSIINDRPYLVKLDKTRDFEPYQIHALFRYVYGLLKLYGENPYKSRIMVEEPAWIVFLNMQTGSRYRTGCSAGQDIISVLVDGTVTPCPLGACYYVRLGNVRTGIRGFGLMTSSG
jgi:Predicted Fe-S oxidoreductases